MAEWLGNGLQNRVQRFESARYLKNPHFMRIFLSQDTVFQKHTKFNINLTFTLKQHRQNSFNLQQKITIKINVWETYIWS